MDDDKTHMIVWGELVNKRLLVSVTFPNGTKMPLAEAILLEVAPSGKFLCLRMGGSQGVIRNSWHLLKDVFLREVLVDNTPEEGDV